MNVIKDRNVTVKPNAMELIARMVEILTVISDMSTEKDVQDWCFYQIGELIEEENWIEKAERMPGSTPASC